jgi:hypothetical protein
MAEPGGKAGDAHDVLAAGGVGALRSGSNKEEFLVLFLNNSVVPPIVGPSQSSTDEFHTSQREIFTDWCLTTLDLWIGWITVMHIHIINISGFKSAWHDAPLWFDTICVYVDLNGVDRERNVMVAAIGGLEGFRGSC